MKTWARARRLVAAMAGALAGVPDEALRRVRDGADATALELPQLVRQLEAERARLVDAQAVAMVGSWETDLSSFEEVWSAETYRIFETNVSTFHPTRNAFLELTHPDDRAAVNDTFARSIGQPGPHAIEHRLLMPDGRVKFVEERWRSFSDDAGRPVRAVGTCQDITDRKLTENALRESDEKFRQLADHITDAFWIRSSDMRSLYYISPAFERIWGRSVQSLYANPSKWADFIVPQDRARVLAAFDALAEDSPLDVEYRITRPDDEIRWVRVRGFRVRDAAGAVIRHSGIVTDITDQKRTEAALQESVEQITRTNRALTMLSSAAGASADGTAFFAQLVANMAGALGAHGAFLAELLPGAPLMARMIAAQVEGTVIPTFDYAVAGTFCERLLSSDETVISTLPGDQGPGELARVAPGARGYVGRRLAGSAGRPLGLLFVVFQELPEDAAFLTKTLQIFAARAASELERQAFESRFLRAQRLESIGTLAGGIAHDLNNVLTPILMSVEMLRELVTDEAGLSLLATMQNSARRGADLVQQVLSFARGVDGQRITVNPLHLMRDLLKLMRDTLPKSIDVQLTPGPGLWTVTGDPTQIHQVFLNLCVNARDAMPGGGHLVVTMSNVRLDDQFSRLNSDADPGAYVKVHVEDDGVGIPPAMRDRIFEPFFTTKAIGEGTGLGLSTTMAIVKSHGGFIQLESEVGVGTTFDVYLPANTAEAAVEIVAAAQTGPPRGHGELVLVVDDEEGIRRVAQRLLERSGYRTLLASNGAVGLAMYTEHQQDIAVVLTDMAMPVMDGPALILALKSLNPDVRIVGSSGLTSVAGLARAASAGAEHFLPKPYSGNALLQVLHTALTPAAPRPESR